MSAKPVVMLLAAAAVLAVVAAAGARKPKRRDGPSLIERWGYDPTKEVYQHGSEPQWGVYMRIPEELYLRNGRVYRYRPATEEDVEIFLERPEISHAMLMPGPPGEPPFIEFMWDGPTGPVPLGPDLVTEGEIARWLPGIDPADPASWPPEFHDIATKLRRVFAQAQG